MEWNSRFGDGLDIGLVNYGTETAVSYFLRACGQFDSLGEHGVHQLMYSSSGPTAKTDS